MPPSAEHPRDSRAPGGDAPDAALLKWFQHGSQDAATQLYLRYARRLRALIREQCSIDLARRVEADDIVQSVFRTFFHGATQGFYQVPEGEDLWKLLLVIALNKIRAQGTYHHAAKRDVRRTSPIESDEASRDISNQESGEEAYFQLMITEALERLSAPHREMVQLRIEGYEVVEIAQKTGRAKRTVERILQESRRKLSELLLGGD